MRLPWHPSCPGDATYTSLEGHIAVWTSRRDGLVAQMKELLQKGTFDGQPIDVNRAHRLIEAGEDLLDRARDLAAGH